MRSTSHHPAADRTCLKLSKMMSDSALPGVGEESLGDQAPSGPVAIRLGATVYSLPILPALVLLLRAERRVATASAARIRLPHLLTSQKG